MTSPVIVLTDRHEAVRPLKDFFKGRWPQRRADIVHDLSGVDAAITATAGRVRLISLLTNIIVPRDILRRLALEPYNIHPGPPEYPGSHVESFAIWEGAIEYGVTAHVMAVRVDSGPIVGLRRFPMPKNADRAGVSDLAYAEAVTVFVDVATRTAVSDGPLPRIGAAWFGPMRTRRAFQRLCAPPSPLSADDWERLKRACGPDLIECVA